MPESEYLASYADINVHRLMLKDEPRTLAYRTAIFANKKAIDGKVVLDVGCGTGILSIFCAQAGAKRVHAVESSSIAKLAKQVVSENGFDQTIIVHECPVEELLLDEKVDVIVSEWMGFYLLHEGMLQSVIYARDKFLAPTGLLFPESADIWVAACELPEFYDYWNDVYGVKMNCLGSAERHQRNEPVVAEISPAHLLTEPSIFASFRIDKISINELSSITHRLISPAKRPGKYQGICLWFVVNFPSEDCEWYRLSTSPEDTVTHWKQTAVVLPEEILVEEGEPIAYEISLRARDGDHRKYNMEVSMLDPDKEEHPVPCMCYKTKCIVIRTHLGITENEDNDGIVFETVDE